MKVYFQQFKIKIYMNTTGPVTTAMLEIEFKNYSVLYYVLYFVQAKKNQEKMLFLRVCSVVALIIN